jgi:hypothetical protein
VPVTVTGARGVNGVIDAPSTWIFHRTTRWRRTPTS